MKTFAVATPTRGMLQALTVRSVMGAVRATIEAEVAAPADSDWWKIASGLPIPDGHEQATEEAMATGADVVWMIEDDQVVPSEALIRSLARMEETGAGLVAVDYPVGEPPPRGNGVRWDSVYREHGDIFFTGLGITLIDRAVFEALERPWFTIDKQMTLVGSGGVNSRKIGLKDGHYATGGVDVVFGLRVRELGFRLAEVPGMIGGHVRLRQLGKYPMNDSPHQIEVWDTIDHPQRIFRGHDSSRFEPEPEMAALRREFARLGPWTTGFDIDGIHYGGTYDALGDPRLEMCRERFG